MKRNLKIRLKLSVPLIILVYPLLKRFILKNGASRESYFLIIATFVIINLFLNEIWTYIKKHKAESVIGLFGVFALVQYLPIYAPQVDFSLGNYRYGLINYSNTLVKRELNIDVTPPIFLIKNCQEIPIQGIYEVSTEYYQSTVEVKLIKENDGSNKIRVCVHDLDRWKVGKISTVVDVLSLQYISLSYDWKLVEIIGENNITINEFIVENGTFFKPIYIKNFESFTVYSYVELYINNKSQIWEEMQKITQKQECEDHFVKAYYTEGSINNSTRYFETNVYPYNPEGLIKLNFLGSAKPKEEKTIYFIFECIPKPR